MYFWYSYTRSILHQYPLSPIHPQILYTASQPPPNVYRLIEHQPCSPCGLPTKTASSAWLIHSIETLKHQPHQQQQWQIGNENNNNNKKSNQRQHIMSSLELTHHPLHLVPVSPFKTIGRHCHCHAPTPPQLEKNNASNNSTTAFFVASSTVLPTNLQREETTAYFWEQYSYCIISISISIILIRII